jgi:cation/acetate symporter
MLKGDFTQNMRLVFLVYLGGCALCAATLMVLSLLGVSDRIVGIAFVLLTVAFYACMGLLSRTAGASGPSDYLVAGRHVPALYNGMATAADWMSAATFLGVAGIIFAQGYDGLAYVVGWTGGYVLVAVLVAPFLRKSGSVTIPDFLAERYGGSTARRVGAAILISVSFTYVVAQLYAIGIIAARFLDIDFSSAVFVGLAGILLCALVGGMRTLIWTQVAQYLVVIFAFLLPLVLLSARDTGVPLPHLMFGRALEQAATVSHDLVADGLPWTRLHHPANFLAIIVSLTLGTASLPHVLSRFLTTPSVRAARLSAAWSLLFLLVLYSLIPAYAAFAKLESLRHVAPLTADWADAWIRLDLLSISHGPDGSVLLHLAPDAVVLATPEIAGLPFVVAALVAAGALAAALSSADGLLLSIGKAVALDLAGPGTATPARRMTALRITMLIAGGLAAGLASLRPAGIVTLVASAFSLAGSGLFPALVLGVWWKRTTKAGAILGMLAGWLTAVLYIVLVQSRLMPPVLGIEAEGAGLFGIPLAMMVTVLVSLTTPAPGERMDRFIESIRIPRGPVRPVDDGA